MTVEVRRFAKTPFAFLRAGRKDLSFSSKIPDYDYWTQALPHRREPAKRQRLGRRHCPSVTSTFYARRLLHCTSPVMGQTRSVGISRYVRT
jgi:hypothetical protein